jgi:phosphatidylinositol 4-phosphatase
LFKERFIFSLLNEKSGDMKIFDSSLSSKEGKKVIECQGIIGNIKLKAGNYLIVVKDKKPVGKISEHQIYLLTGCKNILLNQNSVELIPYEPKKKLTSEEESDEAQYIALLESLLKENSFYFSHTFDLTKNIENNISNPEIPSEDHFWWNKYLCKDLIHFKANEFILPIIRGFVEVENVQLDSHNFVFGLISRQSCKRTGTRYNVRGIDQTGNVANFCENEQFIICRI